jgi:hypothetical protein
VELKLADSGRRALSMDYNFFAAQSRATVDPARRAAFREEMLQTYLAYFQSNYAGNRAPLNIGHHFFDYQDGAYHEALETFARTVCGLPEVRCTTYAVLADFMDRLDAPTLEAYRNGDFPHVAAPALTLAASEPEPGGTPAKSPPARHDVTRPPPTLAASEPEPGGTPAKSPPARHDVTRPAPTLAASEPSDTRVESLHGRRHLARLPSQHGAFAGNAAMMPSDIPGYSDAPSAAYRE